MKTIISIILILVVTMFIGYSLDRSNKKHTQEAIMIHKFKNPSLPTYEAKTLKNGFEIVVIPLHNKTNVISTNIFYKVGSRNEVMGKTGIAHMLEHMNFKSTKNLKAGEFDKDVKGFGGVDNASTGFDYTHYYIKSSTQHLKESIDLFAELMAHLSLKNNEFQPERNVVAEERRWRTDNNPLGFLYFKLFNNAYVYHPYHWTPIGFMNDIKTWTLQDIKDFHKTYYQPQNAILVVTGDVEPKEVFKYAIKAFGDIKNSKPIPKVKFIEPKQDGSKQLIIYKTSEVQMLAMAFHIPNFQNKDQVALSAISELLSSGKSSILYSNLVDKSHLVNQIYAYNMENKDPGLFIFMAVCNPDVKATEVEKQIKKQIKLLKTTKVTQADLDKVKINTKADFVYSLESSTSVANLFGGYLARGDMKPLANYEQNIDSLTAQDIQNVAKKYFNYDNSTIVILKNKPKGDK